MPGGLLKNKELIWQLTKRDVLMRYKGSLLGVIWSLITPLIMLGIYTFVFGVVFQARWDRQIDNYFEFALILFCGLIVFGIFAEVVSRAPLLIINNPTYIKRVVFPVEILVPTLFGAALFNAFLSFVILILAIFVLKGSLSLTILYLPLVLTPLIFFSLGLAWFLASTGVYIRDIVQVVPIIVTALMFLSPIFYPISIIPNYLQWVYMINPLSYVVEDARQIIIWGNTPNWLWLALGTLLGIMTAFLGLLWFNKTKKGFADVI